MKIDPSFLPAGYSTTERDGLYAEFYEDGQLRHLGYYEDGALADRSWALYLERGRRGRVERTTTWRYNESIEREAGVSDEEHFEEWVKQWIRTIYGGAGQYHLYCSFCGKSQQEVARLIAGPFVYICNECVQFCNEVLAA